MVDEESPPPRSRSRKRLIGIIVAAVLASVGLYAASLFGYHLLAAERPSISPDSDAPGESIVVVVVDGIRTVDDEIDVQVGVVPNDALMDTRMHVLNTDVAVRLYPPNEAGDLRFAKGSSDALELRTVIPVTGDPDEWPFDSYVSPVISADLIVGSGEDLRYEPARIEVWENLEGWEATTTHSRVATESSQDSDGQSISMKRGKGPLIFDLGICLVLVSLPVMALTIAIQLLRGRKQFMPPFATWYAAMLFAVVPLRNLLPGSPPAGAWVDQVIVLWVLIALIVAMGIYVVAWQRHSK